MILALLISISFLIAPYKVLINARTPIHRHLSEISRIESGHDNNAIGKLGERGRHQIMPAMLEAFNKEFHTCFKPKDLRDKLLSRIVSMWLFIKNGNHFYKDQPKDRLVKTINAHPVGAGKTDSGLYYFWYLEQIVPWEFKLFLEKHKIVWKGKRFLKIKI